LNSYIQDGNESRDIILAWGSLLYCFSISDYCFYYFSIQVTFNFFLYKTCVKNHYHISHLN